MRRSESVTTYLANLQLLFLALGIVLLRVEVEPRKHVALVLWLGGVLPVVRALTAVLVLALVVCQTELVVAVRFVSFTVARFQLALLLLLAPPDHLVDERQVGLLLLRSLAVCALAAQPSHLPLLT